jgi:hypothetical protein
MMVDTGVHRFERRADARQPKRIGCAKWAMGKGIVSFSFCFFAL